MITERHYLRDRDSPVARRPPSVRLTFLADTNTCSYPWRLEPLKPYEIETLLRSAAMAPLATETVRRVLEAHRDALARDAELEALVARLRPAWEEVREILNALVKVGDR